MINYLAPIFRTQFNLYYRYGYTLIPTSQVIKFDGNINDETRKKLVDLFTLISPFEYDEEYVILHLEAEESDNLGNILFEIQNLVSVFPLSKQSKISIESKIDERIRLEQPIFESLLSEIENNIQKVEIRKAIDALWLICNLEGSKEELISEIGFENIFQGMEFRKLGIKASKIKDANYWSFLLAYDRFDYFPNSILGYFYDAGQVFAFSKNHPTFEGSGLYNLLNTLNSTNPNIKLKDTIAILDSEVSVTGYTSQTTLKEIKQYIVSPIFLMLKDELRNSEDVSKSKLVIHSDYLLEFGNNFKAAVVLLGAFFGYKKFYDTYYDKLNLRFYKTHDKSIKQIKSDGKIKNEVKEILTTTHELNIQVVPEPIIQIGDVNEKDEIVNSNSIETDDSLVGFQEIVLSILKDVGDCKPSVLTKEFNKRAKKKYTNINLEGILKEMGNNVEVIRKGKRIEIIKLRSNSSLFDNG